MSFYVPDRCIRCEKPDDNLDRHQRYRSGPGRRSAVNCNPDDSIIHTLAAILERRSDLPMHLYRVSQSSHAGYHNYVSHLS